MALALKNLPVVERFVDLDAGEQRSGVCFKINPLGAVPALVDRQGDHPHAVLTQLLGSLEYRDEVAPEPPLVPRGMKAAGTVSFVDATRSSASMRPPPRPERPRGRRG